MNPTTSASTAFAAVGKKLSPEVVDLSSVHIRIASAEEILSWSHGEVKTSETINYRTFKPERDGLFCAKIFGPNHDYECTCGKYKRMKHRGITCEKCGVEVIQSRVRRERLGHIQLATPVSHVWFLKGIPSRIGNLLDMAPRELERVLYYDAYVVIHPGSSNLKEREVLAEEHAEELQDQFPDLRIGMGAEAVKELLMGMDLETLSKTMYEEMRQATSEAKRKKVIKLLKIVEAMRKSGNDPISVIVDVLPVLSPELRPLVPLDGGRFATSDLNDLYRRVLHRNNRLKRLINLRAPELIVRNEKRMLQEAVDTLFDNGRRGRPILGNNKRPLKSLSDILKGKQGRFRQNLLGKRVDYSGRSVIVVGPELKLHQCGLPKLMALELFKPFIFHKLMANYEVPTIKIAKRMLEEKRPEVWEVLDEVTKGHPVMLNRAPTLHRLGIQAFEPLLIEGKAIQLHPLVCTAFNADFDGDQMAVHVPLSVEAQLEARVLIMSNNNILSPANGKPIMTPTQDMVLGLYWMTKEFSGKEEGEARFFYSLEDLQLAYDHARVKLHDRIRIRIHGKMEKTTAGRALLYNYVPVEVPFSMVNRQLKKREMTALVDEASKRGGNKAALQMLDAIKNLGFYHATKAGFSISIEDMAIPAEKVSLLAKAQNEVLEVRQQYVDGLITEGERYNKVIDIWARLTDQVADTMLKNLSSSQQSRDGGSNSIFVMADSGARGSPQQMKQLAGMRGLMAKPSGEIIETPITANFREGLSVLQYFISTHGARKGLADTALKTANSGYLTRRLVDVAQDAIITKYDCGTVDGIEMTALIEAGEIIESLGERVLGRVTLEEVHDPIRNTLLLSPGEEINEEKAQAVEQAGIERMRIRSVLTCIQEYGICALCYGRDLARGRMISSGEAVGVIAAQSIGEPGTQLTMRTFHIGGASSQRAETSRWEGKFSGRLDYSQLRVVKMPDASWIIMGRKAEARIIDEEDRELELRALPVGSRMLVASGEEVKRGQALAEWDPFAAPILSDTQGLVKFSHIIEGISMREQLDKETGLSRKVILESPAANQPTISIHDENGAICLSPDSQQPARFNLPAKAELMVEENQEVVAGATLARLPREILRNRDITGGLPRVAELFEARIPKETSIISEIDGHVSFGKDIKRKQKVVVTPEQGEIKEYLIPRGKHIIVHEGDYVRAGDPIVDGLANPHDMLAVLGAKELQKYLVDEVQEVYRLQGVNIHDKHIEVMVRQMLRQVRVVDPGGTTFLINELVPRHDFERANSDALANNLSPATAKVVLQGITKAALSTDSFISAASFQETTKVLTEAAIHGKVDGLRGLKENVIMGKLIPCGTGFPQFQNTAYRIIDEAAAAAAELEMQARQLEEERLQEMAIKKESTLLSSSAMSSSAMSSSAIPKE